MTFSKFGIFSAPFQFDFGNQVKRKGTILGAILYAFIIIIALIQSAYLFFLYFNNQINPSYAQQSFVSEDPVDIGLSEELIGFRYEYGVNLKLDDLQAQINKTYLLFQMIPLNYTQCTSSKLQGFSYFDFLSLKSYTLTISTSENLISNLIIFIYKCQDTDMFKPFIPNNCVEDDSDFNSIVNNPFANLRLKLHTSQYNTMSYQMQKAQKQINRIKQGYLVQTETTFASCIQYDLQTASSDRQQRIQTTNQTAYMQITIQMDKTFQNNQIYILALLMTLGFLGRRLTQNVIRDDIFLLLLQNIYHGTYEAILQKIKFLDVRQDAQFQNTIKRVVKTNQKEAGQEQEEEKAGKNQYTFNPSIFANSVNSVDNSLQIGSSRIIFLKKKLNKQQRHETFINQQSNYTKSLQEYYANRIKNRCWKQNAYQQSKGLGQIDKQIIESHITESLDVLQIYQDLIFLKKAVMILVSKEQLAAISLRGLSSEYLKIEMNHKKNCKIFDKKFSYFEEQYSIFKSNDLQEQYINSFFQKTLNGEDITEIDKRILNSLN
ncbi:hypothetical protein ABPG72_000588 [Tetrahymena utriculariae]